MRNITIKHSESKLFMTKVKTFTSKIFEEKKEFSQNSKSYSNKKLMKKIIFFYQNLMKYKHFHSKSYVYLCTNSNEIGVYVQNLIKTALLT